MAQSVSFSSLENLPSDVMRRLHKEIAELSTQPPEGIKIIVDDKNITNIRCVIEGPAATPYCGGMFHVKLSLPRDFPASPPRAFFMTKIFHPNVNQSTGEICVNTLKRDWKQDLGVKHILLTIKCLLIDPNPESALNEEAGRLLIENYDDYSRRAALFTDIHAKSKETSCGSSKRTAEATEAANAKSAKLHKSRKALKRL